MNSWWDLGEYIGDLGSELQLYRITCPFCMERGNFSYTYHAEKKKANPSKVLNFDTLKCNNCAGYVMCLWSTSSPHGDLYNFHVLPWPIRVEQSPAEWPDDVGRFWIQAHRCASDENWDASAVMARSSLQLALRQQGANGRSLRDEIEDLATRGLLPPIMKEWSHEIRELGNESAHPNPGQAPTAPQDVNDLLQFIDYFLKYLYTLPHQIEMYRKRKSGNDG